MSQPVETGRPKRRLPILLLTLFIVCLGFFIRLHLAKGESECHWRSPDSYVSIATNMVSGHGFLDSFSNLGVPDRTRRPPLLPFVLAGLMKVFGIEGGASAYLILQALLGALTGVLIGAWGWRLTRSLPLYFGIAFVYSVWGSALVFSPCIMTEVLFIFLFSSACLVLAKGFETAGPKLFLAAGALVGLASLTRPVLYPITLFLAIAWPYLFGKNPLVNKKKKIIAAICFFGMLAIVLLPWIVRNSHINQRVTLITSSIGLNLVIENTPAQRHQMWEKLQQEAGPGGGLSKMDEQERDRALAAQAKNAILQDPIGFAGRFADRVIHLYNHSNDNAPEPIFGIHWNWWGTGLMIFGLIVLLPIRFNAALFLILIQANFALVYGLTFFEARFREAAMPAHLVLAGIGALALFRKASLYMRRKRAS